MVKYWISARKVSGGQFVDQIDLGATRYLRVPDGQTPAPSQEIARTQWVKEILGLFPVKDPAYGPSGDILFFVHGFNNTINDVDQRHQLVQAGLAANNFDCRVISFDWPCDDVALAYLDDRDHAKKTAILLVNAGIKPFVAAQARICDINVHVLGHSMGAYLIREAFDHADDGQTSSANWTANQLVLIAGDVSAASFSQSNPSTESTYRHCYRLTNYFNGYDEVLQISNAKRIGLAPRVGRVGLPPDVPDKAVNIDCSAYFHNTYGSGGPGLDIATLSHSWFFKDQVFLKDLSETLRGATDRQFVAVRGEPDPAGTQQLVRKG
jgi:pimeloyl-ACP methyl ester carboxylesterase